MGVAQVTTEKGTLNLRKAPDSKAGVLERIPNHSLVEVCVQSEPFWQISYAGQTGYAMSEFLTMTAYPPEALAYRVLFRGSQGDDVLALKQRLLALGYYREGATMTDSYNETCIQRVQLFEQVNGLAQDGIATPAVQALLFSPDALVNTQPLPAPQVSSYVISDSSGASTSDDIDWAQWMLDHPGVCPCCMGKGCPCCNWTGEI